jgi:uncharacterized membrane protein
VTFENWFEIASKNIAKSELSQLRNELENHVFDAINMHQQTGFSTLEAEQKAVLELGDPKRAARGFEREFLTRDQARRFVPESKGSIWFKIIGAPVFSAIVLLVLWNISKQYPQLFPAFSTFFGGNCFFVGLLMLLDSLTRYMLVRQPSVPMLASMIVIEYLTMTTAVVLWYLFALSPFQIPLWTCLGMLTFLLGGMIYVEVPILRKLRARA